MQQIYQTLQSYYNFQAAVLRSMDFESMSKAEFGRLTGLYGNSKLRRQQNPDLWKPTEIYSLAVKLDLWDGVSRRLANLATLVTNLPDAERKSLLKAAVINQEKLHERLQNSDTWQAIELVKIRDWCRRSEVHISGVQSTNSIAMFR